MKNKNKALGKGLSALFDEEDPIIESSSSAVNNITITDIKAGKFQPRKSFDVEKIDELKASIKENGVIQPIILRAIDDTYEIIAGERRWRACKDLGLTEIPAIIKDLNDNQALELAIIENIQRQNLSVIEEAEGFKRLQEEFKYTQEQLANKLGKSRSHISNILRVLTLPENIKSLIDDEQITVGHAKILVNLDSDKQEEIVGKIIEENLSVRETEKLCSDERNKKSKFTAVKVLEKDNSNKKRHKDKDIIELEEAITQSLGLKVEINDKESDSNVVISFNNLSELDKILHKLS